MIERKGRAVAVEQLDDLPQISHSRITYSPRCDTGPSDRDVLLPQRGRTTGRAKPLPVESENTSKITEDTPLRELQSIVNLLPGLFKALPILAAYLVVVRFAIGQVRGWKSPVGGQEMAYALVGLAAFLWVLSR